MGRMKAAFGVTPHRAHAIGIGIGIAHSMRKSRH
jgi:hypothetical protein